MLTEFCVMFFSLSLPVLSPILQDEYLTLTRQAAISRQRVTQPNLTWN